MKRFVCCLICLCIMVSSFVFDASASDGDIILTINDEVKSYVIAPQLVNGEMFVPVMDVFKDLSCEVIYIRELHTVTVKRNNITVKMTTDSKTAYINGEEHTLNVAPTAIEGKLMVPCKFFLDAIGDTGYYDERTNTYKIESGYLKEVAYQSGLAPLYSNVHRDIPKDFSTGNSYDDIVYYPEDEMTNSLSLIDGEDIFVMDDLINNCKPTEATTVYSSYEQVTTSMGDTMRYTVTSVPESETSCIYNMNKEITGFADGDTLFVSFKMRRVSGGDANGCARISLQVQEKLGKYFNSVVIEHSMKWAPYESNPDAA